MDLMGKFEGYNVYRVSNLASAAHEDDSIYVTPAGNMYLWRTCVGVIDMKSGRVMDFEVPEQIQRNVDHLRYMRQKRAEEKAKKETKVEAEVKVKETVPVTTDDFFERIDAEINALLESLKQEEKKKSTEAYSYAFN
jgi:hypothetical protein